ncbi:MAG: hypothetical protein ACK5H1_10500 [Tenacibaculum sp.]
MKVFKYNINLIKIFVLTFLLFATTSCTYEEIEKESIAEIDQSNYNKIYEFRVKHQGQTFYADISDTEIILNWPQNIELPNSITPAIFTLGNFKLSPASHVEINPREKVTYTLTSKEGNKENTQKVYTLRINLLQPKIKIIEADPISLPIEASYRQAYSVYGEGFSLTKEENKVFLVSEDGSVEHPLKIDLMIAAYKTGYADRMRLVMPSAESLKEGSYRLKIRFKSEEAISKNIYFNLKEHNIPYLGPIPEDKIRKINGIRCLVLNYNNNQTYMLPGENLSKQKSKGRVNFYRYLNVDNATQHSSPITNLDEDGKTILDDQVLNFKFDKAGNVKPNFVYNNGVSVEFGSFPNEITVYLRDENGEMIGIYFEQK